MLREVTPPAASAEILDELARHMRLAPDLAAEQTAELSDVFAAAVSHLEATLGLCLSPRGFAWRACFDPDGRARSPIGPVIALTGAREADGGAAIPLDGIEVSHGERRGVFVAPSLRWRKVELNFDAGFGADWSATPGDLRHAAKMLAAHYYDQRHAAGGETRATLYGLTTLIQPWRPLRLSFSGGA